MILCGVDPSDEAAQAARFAAELAVRIGTRLLLVHVAPQPWVSTHSPDYDERMREQEAFDRAGHLSSVLGPISVNSAAAVERLVEFGRPDEVLRSVAKERQVTHLVLGSRGQGRSKKFSPAARAARWRGKHRARSSSFRPTRLPGATTVRTRPLSAASTGPQVRSPPRGARLSWLSTSRRGSCLRW